MIDARQPDGSPSDAPIDASARRCDPAKPFANPVALDAVNTSSHERCPSLTPDELTLYFHSDRAGVGTLGGYDVFVATRPSLALPFGTPSPVANINSAGDDACPSITGDGLFLYVDRYDAAMTGWDIWVAQRASTSVDFGAPTRIASINSNGAVQDDNQFVLPDNTALYFASDRTQNNEIYRAARNVGGTFGAAAATLSLPNSNEVSVAVTEDELTMYFSSDAAPSAGSYDIWMSKRTTTADGWGTPVHLANLSTAEYDVVSWVSPDGCDIYLSHDVTGNGGELFWARKPM